MESREPKPKSIRYYQNVLLKGDASQWRALLNQCKNHYNIAFEVARAISGISEQVDKPMLALWTKGIESAQPGIRIGDEDMDGSIRSLKQTQYSDGLD